VRYSILKGIIVVSGIVMMTSLANAAEKITLKEFLASIKNHHPYFKEKALGVDALATRRERLLGKEDWTLAVNPYISHAEPPQLTSVTPEERDQAHIQAGVERLFWKTGGRLGLSGLYDYYDQQFPESAETPGNPYNPSSFSGPPTYHEAGVHLTYNQPLWKNRGGILDRTEYDLEGYLVNISGYQALEAQESFLLNMTDVFIAWAYETEKVAISRRRLDYAEQQLERTRSNRLVNLVEEVDLLRSEDEVRIARANLTQAEADWKTRQAHVAVMAQDSSLLEKEPAYDLFASVPIPDLEKVRDRLLTESRVIRALDEKEERVKRRMKTFDNTENPQLDLKLSGGLNNADEEWGEAQKLDKVDLMAAIQFVYPLGNHQARAEYAASMIELAQVREERMNAELSLLSQLEQKVIQIRDLEKVLILNREQIELAKKRTIEEQRLYEQGRNDLAFVIQSRDNVERSTLQYTMNALQYQRLYIQYLALMDELLPGEPDSVKEKE